MVPFPASSSTTWWEKAGYAASGYEDVFYHDVPRSSQLKARRRGRDERHEKALREGVASRRLAGGADALPAVPRRPEVSLPPGRRATPASASGIEADEMAGGHYVMLSRPRELAERLDAYAEAVP